MSRSHSASTTRATANRTAGPRHKNRGGMLLGVFLGILIGIICAFGVVWYINKTPLPFSDKTARGDKTETSSDGKTASSASPITGGAANPAPLPGKPGDKALDGGHEKPRFEFYKILPGSQEAAPAPNETRPGGDANLPANPGTTAAANATTAAAPVIIETYFLQAGAFQKAVDADNLKAKLALMGLETSVQEVNVPEKGLMHRVRIGPFNKLEHMNRVRTQLSQNGIQATVVKLKENAPTAQ